MVRGGEKKLCPKEEPGVRLIEGGKVKGKLEGSISPKGKVKGCEGEWAVKGTGLGKMDCSGQLVITENKRKVRVGDENGQIGQEPGIQQTTKTGTENCENPEKLHKGRNNGPSHPVGRRRRGVERSRKKGEADDHE